MTKEPCSPQGWTTDTLEKHLTSRIQSVETILNIRLDGVEKNVDSAYSAADKALTKAEHANEKRFEGVNEFRKALTDQTATFIPRSECELQIKSLNEIISSSVDRISRIESRGLGKAESVSAMGALTVGILLGITALAAILAVFLPHR